MTRRTLAGRFRSMRRRGAGSGVFGCVMDGTRRMTGEQRRRLVGPRVWKAHSMSHGPCVGQSSEQHAQRCRRNVSVTAYKAPLRPPLSYREHHESQIPCCSLSRFLCCASRPVSAPIRSVLNRCVPSNHYSTLYPQLITELQRVFSFVLCCSRFRFWGGHRCVAPCAMPAWGLVCQRLLLALIAQIPSVVCW